MNKTILGIGLKRIGLILISVSLILFMHWCWQLHLLLTPVKALTDPLADYDHIQITVVNVLDQIDQYEVEEFDGDSRTYYLYLVSVDTEDHGYVVYESRLPSVETLNRQLPMTMEAEVFVLRGEKLALVQKSASNYTSFGTFYPYQVKSLSYDVSSAVFSIILAIVGIVCFINGKKRLAG